VSTLASFGIRTQERLSTGLGDNIIEP
jgi:hypothetical protein